MRNFTKIQIGGYKQSLYVNPNEARGSKLIEAGGITQPPLTKFWEAAVRTWNPTIVIDAGVNYGEVLFLPQYGNETLLYGIEANEDFIPYHIKSIKEHPNQKQFNLIYALAMEHEEESIPFYINKKWSGASSSASACGTSNNYEKKMIKSIRIDRLFEGFAWNRTHRLLFKIDVEGFEEHVIRGMTNLLESCKQSIGYIEFDNYLLQRAGTDAEQFLSFLSSQFDVYVQDKDQLMPVSPPSIATLQGHFKKKDFHTDLVLFSDRQIRNELKSQLG
jgi:FkbM family methyltransferase